MNKRVIKSVLKKKFNDWVLSIKDENVKKLIEKNTIITGGAIASMLLKEKVKDYDVYFTDKETTKAVAEYYVEKFNKSKGGTFKNRLGYNIKAIVVDGKDIEDKTPEFMSQYANQLKCPSHMIQNVDPDRIKILIRSDGVAGEDINLDVPFEDYMERVEDGDELPEEALKDDKKEKYRPVFLSSNAITLSERIQIVIRFHGNVEKIHKNYDYVHCMNAWTSENNKLHLRQDALESLITKNLVYNGSKYPVCSVIRMRKFIKRGWYINAGQIIKMLFQISKLDLTDVAMLEDQLVGVDSAYFTNFIDVLRKKFEENKDFKLEEQYVNTVIDRIFG